MFSYKFKDYSPQMKFEESKYFKELNHKKVEFSFGEFFLFDTFIISELKEGIHFDWGKIQEVIGMLIDHYGNEPRIGYVSNRVHSYSIEPQLWINFHNDYDFIVATAIISYSDFNYLNATIEKHFTKISLKRCFSLDDAIGWMQDLEEFNQN